MMKTERMAMPPGFKYRDVFLKGKPRHECLDPFRIRHPSMDPGRRAKIFAPFDALKGFDEAIRLSEERCAAETETKKAAEAAPRR